VGGGEIDLVTRCKPDGCLVFVEVKTRSAGQLGRPLDAVDARKRRRIRSGARVWMRMLDDPDVPYRYDVVEVIIGTSEEVHIVPGAFTDER